MIDIAQSLKAITASTKSSTTVQQRQRSLIVPRTHPRKKSDVRDDEEQESLRFPEFQRDLEEMHDDMGDTTWRSGAEVKAHPRSRAKAAAPATALWGEKRPDIQESDVLKSSDVAFALFAAHAKFSIISAADPKCRANVSCCSH